MYSNPRQSEPARWQYCLLTSAAEMIDLCRICLSGDRRTLLDLFSTVFLAIDNENYADQLTFCSGVEVNSYAGFSENKIDLNFPQS